MGMKCKENRVSVGREVHALSEYHLSNGSLGFTGPMREEM
jgi:hypothetical protein